MPSNFDRGGVVRAQDPPPPGNAGPIYVPRYITDLGEGNTYYTTNRISGWNANPPQYRLAGAVGTSSASTNGIIVYQSGTGFYTLSGGSEPGGKVAMQAGTPAAQSFGDVGGFAVGATDRPGVWLESSSPFFQRLQFGDWVDGRVLRVDSLTGRKIGYFNDPSGGGLHPFCQFGALVPNNYRDLNTGSVYSSGVAQAITGDLIGGWVEPAGTPGIQEVCYWTQDLFSNAVVGPIALNPPVHGNVTHICSEAGSRVIIQGFDTDAGRPFFASVDPVLQTHTLVKLGRAAEFTDPQQATENSFVGQIPNTLSPSIFVFTKTDDRFSDGSGCADDIRAILTPRVGILAIHNSTRVTGIGSATVTPGQWVMGGTDLADSKIWIAPQNEFHYNTSGPAPGNWLTPIHAILTSNSRLNDAAFVDGMYLSLFKGKGGTGGELASAQVDTILPAVLGGGTWFRVTSRVHTGVYQMNVRLWNFSTQSWNDHGDVPIYPYMLTHDINVGPDETDPNDPAGTRIRALLKVYNGVGTLGASWEIEQARAISWDGNGG